MNYGSRILLLALLALAPLQAGAEEPFKLTGLMGIGIDSMPGLNPTSSLDPTQSFAAAQNLIATPNAVSFRYWVSESFSWEGQLAVNFSSQPSNSTETAATVNRAFGIGTALKYNISRPSELFLAQATFGASLAIAGTGADQPSATAAGQNTSTFSLYVGTGFEAFTPWWKNLSLEGQARLRVTTTQTKTEGPIQATQSSSSLGLMGDGFSPLTLAIHYYF